jgi:TolB-like protein
MAVVKRPARALIKAIEEQIERVLNSPVFTGSRTLRRLLIYLADQTLAGHPFNEYSLAMDVFQKGEDFDPRIDPSVRVHMCRLRQKLNEYRTKVGRLDPIAITLPPRTYTLAFQARPDHFLALNLPNSQRHVAVRSFRCLSSEECDAHFCGGLLAELICAMAKLPYLRVIPIQTLEGQPGNPSHRELREQFHVDAILDGEVRRRDHMVRVAAHLADTADGSILWAEMYEHDVADSCAAQEKIADAIVSALFASKARVPDVTSVMNREGREENTTAVVHAFVA